MKPIVYSATVDNPMLEELAIDRAKHEFIMASDLLWRDWTQFMPDSDYKERTQEFYKRISVLSTTPSVSVVDGWYRVTSVTVTMQYKGGVANVI